jgi:hypothetical protein
MKWLKKYILHILAFIVPGGFGCLYFIFNFATHYDITETFIILLFSALFLLLILLLVISSKTENKFNIIAKWDKLGLTSAAVFFLLALFYTHGISKYTYYYPSLNVRILRGEMDSIAIKRCIAKGILNSDCEADMISKYDSKLVVDNYSIWTRASVNRSGFIVLSNYGMMILCFSVCIFSLIEHYSKLKRAVSVKIFLASSFELKEDRKELRIFFSVENDRLYEQGLYLKLVQWEYFLDSMSATRMQAEYNKAVAMCDILVALFQTKAGTYTVEEFNTAWKRFKSTKSPIIYTYFKHTDPAQDTGNTVEESLIAFKKELEGTGHFPTHYENIQDLKLQLKLQLERILPELVPDTKKAT